MIYFNLLIPKMASNWQSVDKRQSILDLEITNLYIVANKAKIADIQQI